ncbi:hypothetical protein, partial [Paraburkholderia sp. BCC1885]|uniref:hypothetical protein n=1 Tax=Paraburkholderia sp. BCC1885 TaxID=2562669 RepID=UPI001C90BE36
VGVVSIGICFFFHSVIAVLSLLNSQSARAEDTSTASVDQPSDVTNRITTTKASFCSPILNEYSRSDI